MFMYSAPHHTERLENGGTLKENTEAIDRVYLLQVVETLGRDGGTLGVPKS